MTYIQPDRTYDTQLLVDEAYVATLPDLQNWPSSLIQGRPVAIPKVGIHNFRLPLKFPKRDGGYIELETRVTGTVSLEAHKKGINMSRIMRRFYKFKEALFSADFITEILADYKKELWSFDAHIMLKLSYPMIQKSLRSDNEGYQYYDVSIEVCQWWDKIHKYIHFDYVYSSACPCSFELAEHARMNRNKATVSHSQRSVARVSVEFDGMLWFEDLKDLCLEALKTETQVVVKREDEQAFAELNGSYLKFVEDAARLMYDVLDKDERVKDFRVVCSHQESLHSHDAISVIVKWVEWGFTAEVSHEFYSSLIHRS